MDIKRFYKMLTVLFVILFYAGETRAEVLEDREYIYDNVGNITGVIDRVNGGQAFQYDEQNRLVGASGDNYNENYSYTKNGNINSKGGKRYTYPAPGQPQPHAPLSDGVYNFTYDKRGNLKTKIKYDGERWDYFYDYDYRLSKVVKNNEVLGEYWYDDVGNMIKRKEGEHTTLYINDTYEERDGVPYTFYYANGERVAERVGTGPESKLYYYHNDHLGGTSIITDEGGNVVKEVQYFPFGKTRKETGTKEAPYKFTGKEFSSSTGLYYYGARWYDPDLGRFISPDPLYSPDLAAEVSRNVFKNAGGVNSFVSSDPNGTDNFYNSQPNEELLHNPQLLNRYSYTVNNPLKYVDPDGRLPVGELLRGYYNYIVSLMSDDRNLNGTSKPHTGVDSSVAGNLDGIGVMAAADGIVVKVGNVGSGYGYGAVIYHEDTKTATLYAHLRDKPNLEVGKPIKEGNYIGIMGHTGCDAGTPPCRTHLHFEIGDASKVGGNFRRFSELPKINPVNPETGPVNLGKFKSVNEIPYER